MISISDPESGVDPFLGNVDLCRGKYRISSPRLKGWDYRSPGWYFVTICTKGRSHWFGEIENGKMNMSVVGKIVDEEWKKTAIVRSYVTLDAYVIMPDHLHGILHITPPSKEETREPRVSTNQTMTNERTQIFDRTFVETSRWDVSKKQYTNISDDETRDPQSNAVMGPKYNDDTFPNETREPFHDETREPRVSTNQTTTNQTTTNQTTTNERTFKLAPASLGSIINQFKSVCTKQIRTDYPDFHWQPRFHDHLIRFEGELNAIRKYIRENPSKWKPHPDLAWLNPFAS